LAFVLIGVVLLLLPTSAGGEGWPFVRRQGTQLLLQGKPYRFSGLNIYNANSTNDNCWYSMGSGPILGQSLRQIGRGKEVFRAWFFQSLATKNGRRDWAAFDHTLAVAAIHGYRVIVTLANQWGDCEPASGYRNDAWYRSGYQVVPDPLVSYRDWVKEIVTRYRFVPSILAWQLINEAEVKASRDANSCPADAAQVLKSWAADVSGVIKSIDRYHLISLGTIGSGQCGASFVEYKDVHSVSTIDLCEYHDYGAPLNPMPGDPFNGLAFRIQQCNELNKPLFVGETGIIPNDVGGTLAGRAVAFDNKFRAQFGAGVVGELAWAWSDLGSTLDNYDIGPGDPALVVLGRY
jgi:mannan endo-1,4-beta-mannosidase